LAKYQVEWVPAEENLWFSLDNLELRTLGVYSIPCECGQIYNGKRGCLINTRLKEYHWHIWLEQPHKSEMVKHSINLGHPVQLHNTILVSYGKVRK
jgi:hypothetical protein